MKEVTVLVGMKLTVSDSTDTQMIINSMNQVVHSLSKFDGIIEVQFREFNIPTVEQKDKDSDEVSTLH